MKRYKKGSFTAVAVDYARKIIAGKTDACLQVRQAAQRFIDDFERKDIALDEAEVDRVCNFAQACRHVKGKWAGQPIKLEPFQVFILANIFGWIEVATGLRRYRQAFILLPRKNGKSLLAAIIAILMTFADGEPGAEGYSGATSLDQAMEVFTPAKRIVELSPGLAEALDIETGARSIFSQTTGSSFKPVIANTKDGASPHIAICDELHQAINSTQINAFRTGMGARSQPLLLIISTAGENIAGVCRTEQRAAEDVLANRKKNDRLFALIYTIDDGDDWRDAKSWRKANPNWGVSIGADYLRDQLADARQSPAKQAALRTKHLNEWVTGSRGWLSPTLWASAADTSLDIDSYRGRGLPAYLGVDLSTRHDLTAVALIVEDAGKRIIFPRAYLPAGALEASVNAPAYREWIADGALVETPGDASSFKEVEDYIEELHRDFNLRSAVFDTWQGAQMMATVQSWGVETKAYPSSDRATWTLILDDFEADLKNGKIAHPANPVLDWCAINTSIYTRGITRTPQKPTPNSPQKIDVMVASLYAYHASKIAVSAPAFTDVFWL